MPMPITSVAAAASHGPPQILPRAGETEAGALKCASSITVHMSSSGGWVGGLKLRGRSRSTSSNRFSSIILLLECCKLLPELRSCRGESALGSPFRNPQDSSDLSVRVSLNVVHYQRRPVSFRKIVHRPSDAFLEIRLRFGRGGLDQIRFVERYLTCEPHLASSCVRDHGHHDSMQPGRERRVSPELRESRKRADEGVLRELPCSLRITAHSVSERVDAGRVRVVQRTPGQPISRDDPGDEL